MYVLQTSIKFLHESTHERSGDRKEQRKQFWWSFGPGSCWTKVELLLELQILSSGESCDGD
jgi:hypothetical protein